MSQEISDHDEAVAYAAIRVLVKQGVIETAKRPDGTQIVVYPTYERIYVDIKEAQAELDAADTVTEDMRVAGRDILRAWISSDKMHSLESVVQRIYTEMQAARKARGA